MKISYFTSVDLAESGAPAHHVINSVRGLSRRHELTLIHARHKLITKNTLSVPCKARSIYFSKLSGGWRYFELRGAMALRQQDNDGGDLIYLRTSPSPWIANALSASQKFKAMEVNGLEVLDHPAFKTMMSAVDLALVGTDVTRQILSSRFPTCAEKIVVHSNVGIDTHTFLPESRHVARRALGIEEGVELVLHVSGFQPHHDFTTLLNAFSELRGRRPEIRLALIGDGPQRRDIEAKASALRCINSIDFIGSVNTKLLSKYISASNVCINPMTAEKLTTHGNVNAQKTYEYVACARPVVEACDPALPIPDWARQSLICIPPENVASLSAGIEAVLNDQDVWQERIQAARQVVLSSRSWEAVSDHTIQIIEEFRSRRKLQ